MKAKKATTCTMKQSAGSKQSDQLIETTEVVQVVKISM